MTTDGFVPALPLTVRYALAAILCLAGSPSGGRRSAGEIARRTRIPPAFLSKVLAQLGRAGIVNGDRGRNGGYSLARDPATLTLQEVVDAVEGGGRPRECVLMARPCGAGTPCALHGRWVAASEPLAEVLRTTTVAEVAPGACGTVGT